VNTTSPFVVFFTTMHGAYRTNTEFGVCFLANVQPVRATSKSATPAFDELADSRTPPSNVFCAVE